MPYDVTIGIPVYNVEKYIRQTLDSALAQTFPSIEFIICDDCGTDSSIDIVKEYQLSSPRGKDIRIVRQHENMGVGCARNLILEEAQSDYIFFLDSDDLIVENAIESLYHYAKKYDADIVYGSMEKVLVYDNNIKFKSIDYPFSVFLEENEFAKYVYRKYDGIQASSCNFLVKLDIYRENSLRYYPINYWEDMTMSIIMPIYISRAVLLPDITYSYMCRTGTLSNYQKRTHIDKKEIQTTIWAVNSIKEESDFVREKVFFPLWINKVMMTCFYIVCTIIRNKDIIYPSFNEREIHNIMHSPLNLWEVLRFRDCFFSNFFLYLLDLMPDAISIMTIKKIGKLRNLI
jgi:glycosyltransferase involved in cell wall biosynthesis